MQLYNLFLGVAIAVILMLYMIYKHIIAVILIIVAFFVIVGIFGEIKEKINK